MGFNIIPDESKGDIAKAVQSLINTHFVSKRFKDIFGSTRLTRTEIFIFSCMEIIRATSLIISLSPNDVSEEALRELSKEEKEEILEYWALKKRFRYNPHAISYVISASFSYMYGLGMQSLDGMSRDEGVRLASGSYKRIYTPDELGRFDRIKRRLFGDVLFPE